MTDSFTGRLMAWYDRNGRSFVFRGTKDPYRVWISEIMLQQTRTESVTPYYERFLGRFPDVRSLADAAEEDVLRCWQGLGYYSRARNLHRAAKEIVLKHGGQLPASAEALRTLPGVGPYTAAAVASIAFGEPVPAMDGNLIRMFARYTDEDGDAAAPGTRGRLTRTARLLMPADRPGDYNQALMDLGATVCTPGTPDCGRCPVREGCLAHERGHAEARPVLPRKAPPKAVRLNVLLIYWRDRVYMRMRTEALLKGMYVFALDEAPPDRALARLGLPERPLSLRGEARHVFTHRVWDMTLWSVRYDEIPETLIPHFYTGPQMAALPVPVAMRAACACVREDLTHEETRL